MLFRSKVLAGGRGKALQGTPARSAARRHSGKLPAVGTLNNNQPPGASASPQWASASAGASNHCNAKLEASKAAPAKQRMAFQAMLAGFEPYSAEQLQGMWDGEAWLPQRWLEEWSSKTGAR